MAAPLLRGVRGSVRWWVGDPTMEPGPEELGPEDGGVSSGLGGLPCMGPGCAAIRAANRLAEDDLLFLPSLRGLESVELRLDLLVANPLDPKPIMRLLPEAAFAVKLFGSGLVSTVGVPGRSGGFRAGSLEGPCEVSDAPPVGSGYPLGMPDCWLPDDGPPEWVPVEGPAECVPVEGPAERGPIEWVPPEWVPTKWLSMDGPAASRDPPAEWAPIDGPAEWGGEVWLPELPELPEMGAMGG